MGGESLSPSCTNCSCLPVTLPPYEQCSCWTGGVHIFLRSCPLPPTHTHSAHLCVSPPTMQENERCRQLLPWSYPAPAPPATQTAPFLLWVCRRAADLSLQEPAYHAAASVGGSCNCGPTVAAEDTNSDRCRISMYHSYKVLLAGAGPCAL